MKNKNIDETLTGLEEYVVEDPNAPELEETKKKSSDEKKSVLDKGMSMVSNTFQHKDTLFDIVLKLHNELLAVDPEDFPAKENARLYFKNTKNYEFVENNENLLIKNGILLAPSANELSDFFPDLEEGTVFITLPYFREGTDSKIMYPSQIIMKANSGLWRHMKFFNKDIKNEDLKSFDISVLREQ